MVLNIYPADTSTWHYHNYVWSSDKLETVFETLNKIQDNGMIHLNSSISTTEVIHNDPLPTLLRLAKLMTVHI